MVLSTIRIKGHERSGDSTLGVGYVGRGRPPEAAARRAAVRIVEEVLTNGRSCSAGFALAAAALTLIDPS
jgi:hypothetical protein